MWCIVSVFGLGRMFLAVDVLLFFTLLTGFFDVPLCPPLSCVCVRDTTIILAPERASLAAEEVHLCEKGQQDKGAREIRGHPQARGLGARTLGAVRPHRVSVVGLVRFDTVIVGALCECVCFVAHLFQTQVYTSRYMRRHQPGPRWR